MKIWQHCVLFVVWVFTFRGLSLVFAEDGPRIEYPPVCTGFNAGNNSWGYSLGRQREGEDRCPPGMAIFALQPLLKPRFRDPASEPFFGSCCPLPGDALTDREVVAARSCPEGYVGTGISVKALDNGALSYLLRCTEINRERYTLGPRTQGWLLGPPGDAFRDLGAKPWSVEPHRTVRSRVPVSIRYGILRENRYSWDDDGCLGYPWGSVLVGREYYHCTGLEFQQLLLRGKDGRGTEPAPVVRPCRALEHPYSESPKCLDDLPVK